jgi:hypothetical protein
MNQAIQIPAAVKAIIKTTERRTINKNQRGLSQMHFEERLRQLFFYALKRKYIR